MSAPSAAELLDHIRESANRAITYVDGMSKAEFLADERTQQAVILNLIIIGEAAAKLMDSYPDEARSRANIEWRSMRGMRNRIAHGYYDIDLDVVWDTVSSARPDLVRILRD